MEKKLEFNEECFTDTLQLLKTVENSAKHKEYIKRLEENPEEYKYVENLHFSKGRTIWLELEIEDSYLSSSLFSWMYTKSDYSNLNGLKVFGCKLQSIMFNKPSDYTEEEKSAIKVLYEKVVGKENV